MGTSQSSEEEDGLPLYQAHPDLVYKLPNDAETWPRVKAALSAPPTTLDGICVLLHSFADLHPDYEKAHRSFLSFTALIPDLFEGEEENFVEFFTWLCEFSLRIPEFFPTASLPLFRSQHMHQITFTRGQCACLIAHGLLGTLPRLWVQCADTTEKLITGCLRIHYIAECSGGVGLERMRGLLVYLQAVRAGDVSLEDKMTIERVCCDSPPSDAWWAAQTCALQPADVHTESMDCDGPHAFVDFANRDLMIHEIIPSATQEEVLFTARPDMFACLPFIERMYPNEAVLFHNAAPLIATHGYGGSFIVDGLRKEFSKENKDHHVPPSVVLAIDACVNFRGCEFQPYYLLRDLNKCLLSSQAFFERRVIQTKGAVTTGFHELSGPPAPPPTAHISTGLWGCGVFGGTPLLKFLQQAMCASVSGRSIRFSTYGNPLLAGHVRAVYEALVAAHVTVGALFVALRDCPQASRHASQLGTHLTRALTGQVPSVLGDINEE